MQLRLRAMIRSEPESWNSQILELDPKVWDPVLEVAFWGGGMMLYGAAYCDTAPKLNLPRDDLGARDPEARATNLEA